MAYPVCSDILYSIVLSSYSSVTMFRISDKSSAFHGCLADSAGEPLLLDLDTDKVRGAELCYRALPSYEQEVRDREERQGEQERRGEQAGSQSATHHIPSMPSSSSKSVGNNKWQKVNGQWKKCNNEQEVGDREERQGEQEGQRRHAVAGAGVAMQAIPVKNESEVAHLYLPEYYKNKPSCDVLQLDCWAVLNILANSSGFTGDVRKQAESVRDVRREWETAVVDEWGEAEEEDAFLKLKSLASLILSKDRLELT